VPGTDGNPTGLEDEMQRRLLGAGIRPVYLERAVAWHWVPRERCSEHWALRRMYRNATSAVLRGLRSEPRRGLRWLGVPSLEWERYARDVVRVVLTGPLPGRERRFYARLRLWKQLGVIHGYRLAAHGAAPAAANGASGDPRTRAGSEQHRLRRRWARAH
jgi:hypothetical protein